MKFLRLYENGYKAQQAKVKELAKELIGEAISARLANGAVTVDDVELYALVLNDATESSEDAQKAYNDEQVANKGVGE